jgi:hypothetical protein
MQRFVGSLLRPVSIAALSGAPAFAQLLVGVLSNDPNASVWHVDVATGERTPLFRGSTTALAVDDVGGRIFAARGELLSVWNFGAGPTPTLLGSVHRASGSPVPLSGLAYGGGRLFGTAAFVNPWLFEIDPSTLIATPIATPQFLGWVEGLSFDAASGLFYALEDSAGDVYSIDLLNGAAPQFAFQSGFGSDSGALGASGRYYVVFDDGAPIRVFDTSTNTYLPGSIWSPYASGGFECGSEWTTALTPAPGPRVYCVPSQSSVCSIRVNFAGSASASAGSGFVITHSRIASGARVQAHISLAGLSTVPFGTVTRCIRAPIFRLPPAVLPAGSACSGSYDLDFNAYIASGSNPALVAGQTVWMQLAAHSGGPLDLSPGLRFTILP